jgi:hypothetical protein
MAITGGGGMHLLFQLPDLPSGATWRGSLGRGLDFKTTGYIAVPPSIHPSGGVYGWENTLPLAEMPPWLIALAMRVPEIRHAPSRIEVAGSRYVLAALEAECTRVSQAPQGERNHTLNRAAYCIGGLAGLDLGQARAALLGAALAAGLGHVEAERTIESGLGAGVRRPRTIDRRAA